jgi:CheY-like chemotaxis protein
MDSPPLPRGSTSDSASAGASVEPVAATKSQSQSAAANWISVASTRNILVVDDNDRHLDILNTILSSVGHDVEICGSGAEAIRRLMTRRYDVVVLDIIMPEVSGIVVVDQMRIGALNKRTPVIACTANMAIARKQLEEVPGVTAIIGKPIDTANLILAVAKAPVRDRQADAIRI